MRALIVRLGKPNSARLEDVPEAPPSESRPGAALGGARWSGAPTTSS
jgi:hypothetical protein